MVDSGILAAEFKVGFIITGYRNLAHDLGLWLPHLQSEVQGAADLESQPWEAEVGWGVHGHFGYKVNLRQAWTT